VQTIRIKLDVETWLALTRFSEKEKRPTIFQIEKIICDRLVAEGYLKINDDKEKPHDTETKIV
jgi:hypothetical protein